MFKVNLEDYSRDSLHAGVVEIIVGVGAKCRYTTIPKLV